MGTCRPGLRSAFPALSPARPPDSAAPLVGTKPPRGGLRSRAECSWVAGCEGGRLLSECWAQAPPALASVEGPELPEVPRPQREWLDQAPRRHASRGTGQCRVWAVGPRQVGTWAQAGGAGLCRVLPQACRAAN